MHILSDHTKDTKTPIKAYGGYEWWYFDAWDSSNDIGLVVIFYDGNPFSTKYLADKDNKDNAPDKFPAISISVYKKNKPIYYSFTETHWLNASFSENEIKGNVNKHAFECIEKDGRLIYELELNELLASGDSIIANLTFKSDTPSKSLFPDLADASEHSWNLIQPQAMVSGMLKVNKETFQLNGKGYHDHNVGQERMDKSFNDWYWGRFHFKDYSFIYYAMNKHDKVDYKAWLIDQKKQCIAETFSSVDLEYYKRNLFGLTSARKLSFSSNASKAVVQTPIVLDNGPFYQRFKSDIVMEYDGKILSGEGVSEYIKPERILKRSYWPLVHMRIRYDYEKPHWVQQSSMLYRWTW